MKKKYTYRVVMVLFFLLIKNLPVYSQQSPAEKYLVELHEKKFRWMTEKKTDSLSTVLDDRLLYIHSNGWVQNKKEMMDDLKSGKLTINGIKINEAAVRIYKNNTGIITGKGIFNVVINNKEAELNLLYTEVYIKKKNNWLLVSRHACKL